MLFVLRQLTDGQTAVVLIARLQQLTIAVTCHGNYGFGVPAQLFHEFLAADSKGVFFNQRIRPCHPCTKLDA